MALDILHVIHKGLVLSVLRRFLSNDCHGAVEGSIIFDASETKHCHQCIFVASKGIESPPRLSAVFNNFYVFRF